MNQKIKIMKKLIVTVIFGLFCTIIYASQVHTSKIYFESNKHSLDEQKLDAEILKGDLFYLNGYADSDGNQSSNLLLSQRRVQTVKQYLIQSGVNADNIFCNYYGEAFCGENQTEKEKAESRIVEIKYIIDPLLKHEVKKQVFTITNHDAVVLEGREGTIIRIPANCFLEENVQIELQEFYNPLDIMSANLSTLSDGSILETRGMLYLQAKSEEQIVQPQKDVLVEFNSLETNEDGFLVFNGEVDENMAVNWTNPQAAVSDDLEPNTSNFTNQSWQYWYTIDSQNGQRELEFSSNFIFNLAQIMNTRFRHMMDSTSVTLNISKKGEVRLSQYRIKYGTKAEQNELVKSINKACEITQAEPSKESWTFNFMIDTFFLGFSEMDYDLTYSNENRNNAKKAFPIGEFGWINCDRFLSNTNLVDFDVEIASESNVRMLVKSYSSYFNSFNMPNENLVKFRNIPQGEEVVLIATIAKDDKYYLAIEHTQVSDRTFTDFNFQEVSLEDLQERIVNIKL